MPKWVRIQKPRKITQLHNKVVIRKGINQGLVSQDKDGVMKTASKKQFFIVMRLHTILRYFK